MRIKDIPDILRVYAEVKPEDALKTFQYEHSLLFAKNNITYEDGVVHVQEGGVYFHGLNKGMDDVPERFKNIFVNELQDKPEGLTDNYTLDGNIRCFIYANDKQNIELTGKKFTKFRVAKRYLEDEDIELHTFSNKKPLPITMLDDLYGLMENWVEHMSYTDNKAAYNVKIPMNNLVQYGKHIPHYLTLVYHKGTLIHYFLSEQIHPNYIILTDGKFNFAVDKETERKYQYIAMLSHWLHMKKWDNGNPGTVFYNMGNAELDGFKQSLRPKHVLEERTYLIGDVAKSLF